MAEWDESVTRPSAIPPRTRIEVRTGFDQSWTTGFTIEEQTPTGYRLRRRSDGRVLPFVFAFDDVRRERDNMWWV